MAPANEVGLDGSALTLTEDRRAAWVSSVFASEGVLGKLFAIRRERPEVAADLDEIVVALRRAAVTISTRLNAGPELENVITLDAAASRRR